MLLFSSPLSVYSFIFHVAPVIDTVAKLSEYISVSMNILKPLIKSEKYLLTSTFIVRSNVVILLSFCLL